MTDNVKKERIDTAIMEVSLVALEDWGMMLAEPMDEVPEDLQEGEGAYQFTMTFAGPINGKVSGVCSHSFVESLCRNLLGLSEDQDPSEDDCLDSLKEMANVLTGNFVTAAFGEDIVFDLVLPDVKRVNDNSVKTFCEKDGVKYYVADDCGMALNVEI